MSDLVDRLPFFLAADALKEIRRANWVHSTARLENVAEHSWHVLLLAMLFADAAPDGVDHNHVRDLLIVHDLVEVYAGDTPLWNTELQRSEVERELDAAGRLLGMLPVDVRGRFDGLIHEFLEQQTREARFARAIDSLHPLLMSWSEGGSGHSNGEITAAKLIERKRPTIEAYPLLWELVLRILQDEVDRGALPPDDAIQRRGALSGTTSESVLTSSQRTDRIVGLFPRLAFFVTTDRLKEEMRGNLILSHPRRETVAEHCWHVSLLGMLFRDCAPEGVDLDRVADLLIVHDLVEVYAGDTDLFYLADQEAMLAREAEAAGRLLQLLPPEPRERFEALIDEFQLQTTQEARFARAIDTLHPTLLTWVEGAHVHPDRQHTPISASIAVERKRTLLEPYPRLWELLICIVQAAVDRGSLPPDEQFRRKMALEE